MEIYRSAELVRLGRRISTPCLLEIYDKNSLETIEVREILRIVPKRRLTAKAKWRDSSVIVKLFFSPSHWKRNLSRDLSGINLLIERNLRTPAILHETQIAGGRGAALILEYINNGKTISECLDEAKTNSERQRWLSLAIDSISACHRQGLWQPDIHMKNFLESDNQVYYLDGGDIRALQRPLPSELAVKNLALFFAQFTVDNDENIEHLLKRYQLENKILHTKDLKETFAKVKEARARRISRYERKLLRSTTAHRSLRSRGRLAVYDREVDSSILGNLISDPNRYIQKERLLKDGNSTTVAEFIFESKRYVVKRYNLNSLWQSVKYLFKMSRAARCWRSASILSMLGVYTPKPYMFIEDRRLWFLRGKSYFVSEKIEAVNLLEHIEAKGLKQNELEAIIVSFRLLFKIMIEYKISHGDMKASNFLYWNNKIVVLDLDGMRRHRSQRVFKKAIKKDFDRFLKNWKGTEYEQPFENIIDELKTSS